MQLSKSLPSPDSHHLNAALGWIGLGNYNEANEELEKITPAIRVHPDVLLVRWAIFANAKKWEACLEIAKAITAGASDCAQGWLNLSVSLYRLGRTQEAFDSLSTAAPRFSDNWTVSYDLACYAAQLGHLEKSERLIYKALELGNLQQVRKLIMEDPDLAPIRAKFALEEPT
jgi:tetratricopeptide (TPR) repeat protein